MTAGVLWHPSPNVGARRAGASVELIVLHFTDMDSAEAALERLCDPASEVSAHYLIGRDGRAWQVASDGDRAWHAGAGSWGGRGDVNSRSIGIELDNDGASPFAAPMIDRLEVLLADLLARHGLGPEALIAHADMAPGRKRDPGRRFDWRRLAVAGLSVWPHAEGAPQPGDPAQFGEALARFGYPVDAPLEALLEAFRSRFRPCAEGPLDAWDCALARALAEGRVWSGGAESQLAGGSPMAGGPPSDPTAPDHPPSRPAS